MKNPLGLLFLAGLVCCTTPGGGGGVSLGVVRIPAEEARDDREDFIDKAHRLLLRYETARAQVSWQVLVTVDDESRLLQANRTLAAAADACCKHMEAWVRWEHWLANQRLVDGTSRR